MQVLIIFLPFQTMLLKWFYILPEDLTGWSQRTGSPLGYAGFMLPLARTLPNNNLPGFCTFLYLSRKVKLQQCNWQQNSGNFQNRKKTQIKRKSLLSTFMRYLEQSNSLRQESRMLAAKMGVRGNGNCLKGYRVWILQDFLKKFWKLVAQQCEYI